MERTPVCVYTANELGQYAFSERHPFSPLRLETFVQAIKVAKLLGQVEEPQIELASREDLELFHRPSYVDRVLDASKDGAGYLDSGDTPAFPGVYEAAARVVGASLNAIERIMSGRNRKCFIPIGGLHHARPAAAGGFCVFNDCAVIIEVLKRNFGLERIAYVDIDAHHGDGVHYAFVSDHQVIFADIHEDGEFLYPGTGKAEERGVGPATGRKLNIPLPPGADDDIFFSAWKQVEDFLRQEQPQIILFQCGADGLAGDPITHLRYTENVHRRSAAALCLLAEELCEGRLLAWGGGGYLMENVAAAWTEVVRAFVEHEDRIVCECSDLSADEDDDGDSNIDAAFESDETDGQ